MTVVRPTLTPISRNGIDNTSVLSKVRVLGEGDKSSSSCYVKSLCSGLDMTSLATGSNNDGYYYYNKVIIITLAKLTREPSRSHRL